MRWGFYSVAGALVYALIHFTIISPYLQEQHADSLDAKRLAATSLSIISWKDKSGVNTTWPTTLNGIGANLFTVDIEKEWMPKPILFSGSIVDIKSNGTNSYIVELSPTVTSELSLSPVELGLKVYADKQRINAITESGREGNVAVIAKVFKLESSLVTRNYESHAADVRKVTGHAELVELINLGNLSPDSVFTL